MRYKNAIFDADGTIINSFSGIKNCIAYALEKLKLPPLPDETLRKFIGPSLYDSLTSVAGLAHGQAQEAIELYRSRYAVKGVYECTLMKGFPEIFEKLKKAEVRISAASSKPKRFLDVIFENKGIAKYFEKIIGPTDEEFNSDKTRYITDARLEKSAVMIGDRKFDIIAANNAGIDSIGVTFGFCEEGEFIKYPPTFIADSTDEIYKIIAGN